MIIRGRQVYARLRRRVPPHAAVVMGLWLAVLLSGAGAAGAICTNDPGEPNDTFGSATVFTCGQAVVAKICTNTDVDYFRWTPPYGGATAVVMSPPASRDYDLYVYDANQVQLCASILGAGQSETCNVPVSGGATYYVKIVGYNGAFSATDLYALSWTCPPQPAPDVVTQPATNIGAFQATLNASVNARGSNTSVVFQYGVTTSYGSTTGTFGIGANNFPVPVSATVSGLECARTYYFRASAINGGGPAAGLGLAFTTQACPPPTAITQAATSLGTSSAVLNMTVNPNGRPTNAFFQYGLDTSYGQWTVARDAGSGSGSVPYSESVGGLQCGRTYHFQGVATRDGFVAPGGDVPFTTLACQPPAIVTDPATDVGLDHATLNLSANPNGSQTYARFDYGPTLAYGLATPELDLGGGSLGVTRAQLISALACGTPYYFRARARNLGGETLGDGRYLETAPCPPTVTTLPATDVGPNSARLRLVVNPRGRPTTAWIEYGPTSAYGQQTPARDAGMGDTDVGMGEVVSNLACHTTYHYRAWATSDGGTVAGLDQIVLTGRCPSVKGDLDGDGRVDLLLRRLATGQHRAWLLNEGVRTGELVLTPDPTSLEWQVGAVADFDGDGRNDLAYSDANNGAVEFWLLDASGARQGPALALTGASPLAPPWRLAASADFNHDGQPDLVWRNASTQKILIWTLDGTHRIGTLAPVPDQAADANWEIVAAADFNADGNSDLLWYNSNSGAIVFWLMDAVVQRTAGYFANPPRALDANWKVLAAGNYGLGPNGLPGTFDIVWRNATSGRYVIWFLDLAGNRTGSTFTTPAEPPDAAGWTIAGPR